MTAQRDLHPAHALPGPIAVIGTSGQLGHALARLLTGSTVSATPSAPASVFSRAQLDLADPASIDKALAGRGFKTIINTAAWTDVDGAEKDEPGASAVNAHAVAHLARIARDSRATLVTFSTDYVFDGRGSSPYATDHPIAPLNAYGRSKALGEHLLRESGCDHLLIRTSWVYAPRGKNFVRTIAAAARTRPSLRVVTDQRGRPTSADNLASATLALLAKQARGTFHVTDAGECSWFDFAREIVRLAGLSTPVEPCTSADFPRPAPRPAYSVLDISRTEALIGPMMPWQSALAAVMQRLEP